MYTDCSSIAVVSLPILLSQFDPTQINQFLNNENITPFSSSSSSSSSSSATSSESKTIIDTSTLQVNDSKIWDLTEFLASPKDLKYYYLNSNLTASSSSTAVTSSANPVSRIKSESNKKSENFKPKINVSFIELILLFFILIFSLNCWSNIFSTHVIIFLCHSSMAIDLMNILFLYRFLVPLLMMTQKLYGY